jgi:hypothetical protein
VLSGGTGVREATGGFQNDIHAKLFPREQGWIFLGQNLDLVTVDRDRVLPPGDIVLIGAVQVVVLQ